MDNNLANSGCAGKPVSVWPLVAALLVLTTVIFVQYFPSLDFGFLDWDDTAYIQEDSVTSLGLGRNSLQHAFTTFDNPYFMPFTRLSYMADVSLYGLEEARGYRLTNILLHIATSILLFLLVYRGTVRFIPAFLVALLFGIHPQHIEAIVWIAGRKELLAGFFGIISLYCYQQYATAKTQGWYLSALLAYGASLFSKPTWIALPVLLLLWDFFPLQKFTPGKITRQVVEKVPFLVLGLAFALLFNLTIQTDEIPVSYFPEAPWNIRWMLPFVAIGKYLTNTVIPVDLVPYYAFPDQVNIVAGLAWTSLLTGLLYVFWKMRRQYPGLLMAALWFAIALVPALKLTVLPTGESIFIGDRYAYLPHIGLFTGVVLSVDTLLGAQGKHIRSVSLAAIIILVAGFCYSAQAIISHWQQPEQLWKYTLQHNEGKGKAYVYGVLGSYYQKQQRFKEALQAYQQAHDIHPRQFIYPLMVGSLLAQPFRQWQESERWFDKILDESPAPEKILFDYGKNEYLRGNTIRAELFLAKAADRSAGGDSSREINLLLGLSQIKNNSMDKGIASLEKAKLQPDEKAVICQPLLNAVSAADKQAGIEDNALRKFCQKKAD